MFNAFVQGLETYLSTWANQLISVEALRQIIALGLSLIAAWLLQRLLRRFFESAEARYVQIPWVLHFSAVVRQILWPFWTRVLIQLAVTAFQERVWETALLSWASLFISLWLLYRFFYALLQVNLSPELAHTWSRKVVLPLLFFIGLLQATGLMDDILQWTLTPRRDIKITVGSIIAGLAVLALFLVFSRGLGQYLNRAFLPQFNVGPALSQALSTLITYVVVVIGVMIGLNIAGVSLTTLTVIVGGLSVGLGFGLQEIVSNFVSGFILMFERSIGPGDVLKIENTIGVVQRISVRSMIIRTQDNIELVVPNSKFLTETVTNLTRTEDLVRMRIRVGVTYNADPRQVEQLLLTAAQHPGILSEPAPSVQFADFGESSLNFELLVWTKDAARGIQLGSDLRYEIWDTLKAHNIEIPFPQRDLHIRSGVPWENLARHGGSSEDH